MTATAASARGRLRLATAADEQQLFEWRAEQEHAGRAAGWWQGRPVTRDGHREWFRQRFGKVVILIWERDSEACGYVRIDSNGEVSFFPHSGEAVPMLAATWVFAGRFGGRLKATVDQANTAAAEALVAAGFAACPVSFHVYRAALE